MLLVATSKDDQQYVQCSTDVRSYIGAMEGPYMASASNNL